MGRVGCCWRLELECVSKFEVGDADYSAEELAARSGLADRAPRPSPRFGATWASARLFNLFPGTKRMSRYISGQRHG